MVFRVENFYLFSSIDPKQFIVFDVIVNGINNFISFFFLNHCSGIEMLLIIVLI